MIWAIIIHVLMIVICIYAFRENMLKLLICESGIAISIGISVWIWLSLSKSAKVSDTCLDMINEQDFSSQLSHVGYLEADRMIDVYNRMIGELREQRLQVRGKNQFLDLLIEASPMGIIILDFDMVVTSVNPAASRFLQIAAEKLIDHRLTDFNSTLTQAIGALSVEESKVIEVGGINRYRCSLQFFIDRGFRHPFVLIEELTHELIAAEKQASEKLIRTMSHEVNNTLSAINSNLSVLLSLKDNFPENLRPDITRALQLSIERSDHLCRMVSSFADIVKIPQPKPTPTQLNKLVQNTVSLMYSNFAQSGVKCEVQLCSISPVIMADTMQLEQALINILKNAIEACAGTRGTVTVTTTNNPNTLIIRDTGHGIPEELHNQIFTPFFSTKPNGQGIGLMLVREILLNHKFSFGLETTDDCTEFKIVF